MLDGGVQRIELRLPDGRLVVAEIDDRAGSVAVRGPALGPADIAALPGWLSEAPPGVPLDTVQPR